MGDQVEGAERLQVNGLSAHTRQRSQCGQSSRDRLRGVRVHGPGTGVTGVQRREKLTYFGPAAFPDHQAIRAHAQGLPHQLRQVDGAAVFHVVVAGLQPHHVRVLGIELGGILNEHQTFRRAALGQQRREHRGFSGSRGPADHEVGPGSHGRAQHVRHERVDGAAEHQVGQGQPLGCPESNGQQCAARGDRRDHRVNAKPGGGLHVHARVGVVEPAPRGRDETHRERPDVSLRCERRWDPFHTTEGLDEYVLVPVDVHVAETRGG